MKITYSESRNVSIDKLNDLVHLIGWNRNTAKWKKVLEKSAYVVSVYNGEELLGFGRILEDGVMCMFYDICVHPSYQGKGIGTKIMEMLIDKVRDKEYVSIGLFAWEENPQNISFYEKFGFKKVGTGMELEKLMVRE